MPLQIKVGPPTLTISQGRTFAVTTQAGDIPSNTELGVYAIDTRFVNFYRLYLNGEPLEPINSNQLTFYAARFHLNKPIPALVSEGLEAQTLGITLNRIVSEGIHEDFDIVNFSEAKVRCWLEIAITSDFADIFEVRAHRLQKRGQVRTTWQESARQLRTTYDNEDFHRAFNYHILKTDGAVGYANGRIFFEIELEAGQQWHACCEMILEHGQKISKPGRSLCVYQQQKTVTQGVMAANEPPDNFEQRQAQWRAQCTQIATSNKHVSSMYQQAIEDMGALRIYDLDVSDEAWVPAAGVPWFVTLFGRDSLIVALQNMSVSAGFARGALKRLAEYQAISRDDWRDAQPGKILHEIRFGELAHFRKIPFTPYYGTADATILYLLVLSEAFRWTGDHTLLDEYHEAAERCLHWIDTYGDLDGDGFQEYQTYSQVGYDNMSWKDGGDSVVYANGQRVKQPKALCELQGYVYDARLRMAEIFLTRGESTRAESLAQQARDLKRAFNERFWMENEGCYAFGLDPAKQPITSITSNAGHCLWSGIADREKAERTAQRLLQQDMWSGWGIRTLSTGNPAYNPYSYHRGTIWPHDVGIIAAGFKRYGLSNEANYVIRGMFDAIESFDAYRPPEVFAGLQRLGKIDFPTLYPSGANIPQAWASGSIFHMLQTMLGLRADAPRQRLYVAPTLPNWLPEIELRQLRVGACHLNLRFWREGKTTRWEVLDITREVRGDNSSLIEVEEEAEQL